MVSTRFGLSDRARLSSDENEITSFATHRVRAKQARFQTHFGVPSYLNSRILRAIPLSFISRSTGLVPDAFGVFCQACGCRVWSHPFMGQFVSIARFGSNFRDKEHSAETNDDFVNAHSPSMRASRATETVELLPDTAERE
jgi:hypothetical protein